MSSRECYRVGPFNVSPRGASPARLQETAQTYDPGTTCCLHTAIVFMRSGFESPEIVFSFEDKINVIEINFILGFHWRSRRVSDLCWLVFGFLCFWQNLKIGTFFSSVLMGLCMFQMHQCLSAPADSNMTRRRFQELDDELCTQSKALVPQDHQSPTGTTDSTNVTGGEGKESQIHKADSQSTQSSTTFSKLDYSNVTPPQLNPFIVPLTLLKRR